MHVGDKGHGIEKRALIILPCSAHSWKPCLFLCVMVLWAARPQPHNDHSGCCRCDVAGAAGTFVSWFN